MTKVNKKQTLINNACITTVSFFKHIVLINQIINNNKNILALVKINPDSKKTATVTHIKETSFTFS